MVVKQTIARNNNLRLVVLEDGRPALLVPCMGDQFDQYVLAPEGFSIDTPDGPWQVVNRQWKRVAEPLSASGVYIHACQCVHHLHACMGRNLAFKEAEYWLRTVTRNLTAVTAQPSGTSNSPPNIEDVHGRVAHMALPWK